MEEYTYITSQEEFNARVGDIKLSKELGVDLEFDKNRYAYGFNLSMIQVNSGKEIFLIDALAISDLSEMFSILADKEVKKIVFAFGEDIRLLHSVGCFPNNICDLSIAASILNFMPCSLSSLTNQVLEIEEKESSQKSNWLKRPLSDAQLAYAAEDVKYLSQLSETLEADISEKELTQWFKEENLRYELVDYSETQNFSPIKKKEIKELTEYQLYMLEQLVELREEIAKGLNRPGYFIAPKDLLIGLATGKIKLKDMFTVKGVSKSFKDSSAKSAIYEILAGAKEKSERLNISLTASAIKRLSPEEYKEVMIRKKVSDKIVNTVLMPIKEELKTLYGENTASFIFSNKIMNEISKGGLSDQPPYKQKLIWEMANQHNLDLSLLS